MYFLNCFFPNFFYNLQNHLLIEHRIKELINNIKNIMIGKII